jgi:hypothetical protein
MKTAVLLLALSLAACGRESSPEGRSQIRDEKLLKEINSLKIQHRALLDSIKIIHAELKDLRAK